MQQGPLCHAYPPHAPILSRTADALAETLSRRAAGRLDVALPDQGMSLSRVEFGVNLALHRLIR